MFESSKRHLIYPALTGSKTSTSKFGENKEDQLPVKARLVQLIISGG